MLYRDLGLMAVNFTKRSWYKDMIGFRTATVLSLDRINP